MSFGGFGQNNNNQTPSGFGGFGSNNTGGTGGFGATGTSGFGSSTNTGGGLFGGGGTTGGFGTGGGFGASTSTTQSSPFGAAANKPFGQTSTTTGGGLFGGTTATANTGGGFGGFGTNNNTQTATSAFGGGGGMFGGNKPAFGTSTTPTTGTGLFGQGTGGVSGFGAANNGQTGAFGAPATAFQPGTLQSEGTGGVPFAPSTEKEVGPNNTAGPNNVFQSITMMAQYQKFSFEELRLADYAQGRRYGNASNQPGAFGANTGFGGFGNTNTNTGTGFGAGAGGFGAANNPTTGFGTNQQATGAFGANTGGNNLFGTKPFGQTNNATTSAQTSGGLFGTTPATTGNTGFAGGNPFGGANNNNNNNQTGGLNFGGTGTTGGAGFGATGNTGGFGTSNTGGGGGGLFGNTNAAAASTTFGGAGQQQQQPTNPNPFGGFGQAQGQNQQNQNATPAFGTPNQNAQAKPGGLFGNIGTNPAGGGFQLGGNNQATQGTGAFGLGANNNAGGGLDIFGKPLNQAPSPFGNLANNQNNTGNAAAGNNAFGGFTLNPPNQQNQAAGLLGNANQNQQKPSLFGNLGTTNNNAGNAFGNLAKPADNQQLGGGLLGFNNQNQQQPLGGALLGNANFLGATLQNQQQVQQPMGLSTSINDIDPFGGIQLFNGLGLPTAQNIGPIATPLSSAQKTKKNSILPHYKYNPSASTRLMTPQTRGFGFSYSTYGSPSSFSSSVSTPVGLSSSLLGSTIGRTLGKSLSTSNLRRTFDADDSVLAASAFSPNGNRYANTGSLKKLVINRSLRSDLFSQPPNDVSGALPAPDKTDRPQQANGTKKRVSFEPRSSGGHNGESATEPSQVNGSRGSPNGRNGSSPSPNGNNTNGTVESDGEEVRGNELAVVHEDGTPPQPTKSTKTFKGFRNPHADKKIGEYWMSPSMEDLKKMSREDLKHVNGLKIGRRGCGSVEFQTPVDLTTIDLDKIIDVIVVIITRSCTVYPDASVKPEVGKGLNVPARITLENSWPRSDRGRREVFERSGPKYEKHLTRLQRVEMTHFESYDPETGTWIFTVDHFTTYGIDYDEDESVAESGLSVLPNTPQPSSSNAQGLPSHNEDDSMNGDDELDTSFNPDDTFEYKKRKPPPGHLGEPELYEEDDQPNNAQEDQSTGESFFGERSMGSSSRNGVNESNVIQSQGDAIGKDESVIVRDQVMAGSYPDVDHTMGPSENPLQKKSVERGSLGSISPSNSRLNLQRSLLHFDTPVKSKLQLDDDWVEHLGRTISPRKQDRKALRELQENILQDDALEDADATPKARTEAPPNERGIHTSIDLMRSLFGQDQGRKGEKVKDQARVANAGFEWPYHKRFKTNDFGDSSMDSKDNEFHRSIKPHWGPRGTLVYAMPSSSGLIQARRGGSHQPERAIIKNKGALVSQGKDVRFASLNPGNLSIKMLNLQKGFSKVNLTGDVPYAKLHAVFDYEDFMNAVDGTEPHQIYEKHVWELVSCLFDDDYDKPKVNRDIADYFEIRFRKDRLSAFWVKLTQDQARQQVRKAKSKEEGAIYHLSAHQIEDACASLIDGRDYRLATLVAMIGGDEMMRQDMRYQIDEWRRMKLLSEMTEPIRAIYELLAGNTCVCDGFDGPFEDRAWTFVVSKSFGLGWKQAFGLRLWYGIKQEEPISAAVQKYLKDLDAHLEDHARPVPWFVEQRIPLMWDDKNLHRREDLFWGILKIYSDFTDKKQRYALEDILMPENHQLNPMDYQLTWQLYHAFSCARIADIRPEIDNPHEDSPKIDQLTLDFATQLEMAGHWTWALFVILHLLDTPSRALGIQRLLAEHGGDIGDGPDDEVVQLLIEDYRIAQPWIWEAKALHARSVTQDHVKETEYLLKARNWVQAHETMAQNVAPRAVIENETEMLQKLLDGFHDVKFIGRWNLGGQVYVDYLRFLQILEHGEEEEADTMMVDGDDGDSEQDSTSSSRREDRGLPPRNDYEAVLSRLLTALPAMMHHGDRKLGFYERVAVQEMSNVVAEALLDEEDEGLGTKAQLLSLPLTEDSTLKHTVQLSVEYYQAVMAGGK